MSQPIIELPDIVQSLQNKQWTGTLEILTNHGRRTTSLFFRGGMIQHCSPDRNPIRLGRALFDLQMLDEADYAMTLADYEQSGRKVGEVLVELGLADEGAIRRALVHQGREHVLDVFTWKEVDVRFHAGEEKLAEKFTPEQREVHLGLPGMSILMEVARREDERRMLDEVIPTRHDVVAATREEGLPPGALDRRVALLIDCYRSAWEIAEAAPMDTLEVLAALAELVREGHLKTLEPPELVKVGLVAEQDKDYGKALGVFELATSRGLDHLDLHRRIARIHSLLGDQAKALEQWQAVAERCVRVDRRDLAISALQEASELDPSDLELRRRLIDLLIEAEQHEAAAAQLRTVISMAEQAGRSKDEQVALIDQLLELVPTDKPMLERVAALHLERDERLEAMTRLDELATVYITEEVLDQAVAVYYRVLEVDGENLQARLLLAQNLAKMGSTDDAVREYRRLADILYRSGVIGNSINWPFLIKVYESIVELEPSSTPAWEWLAKAYLENGQRELAVSRYLGMADSLQPEGDDPPPPEILQPLRRVVELEPDDVVVRRRLAETHLALGQTHWAVRAFRELAEAHLRQDDLDQARIAFDQALEHDPFDMDSRRGLATIHERLDEKEVAYQAWRAIGGMCHRAGLYEDAVKDFHRAFSIHDDDPVTVRELAEIEEERGRAKNSAMLYARYALLMMNQENFGLAKEALDRANRLEPNLPQVAKLMSRLTTTRA